MTLLQSHAKTIYNKITAKYQNGYFYEHTEFSLSRADIVALGGTISSTSKLQSMFSCNQIKDETH